MSRDILTTYDIAKLLSVDMSTVIDWIDQQKLPAYRTPGGHRRVKKEDLAAFLQTYKMPALKEFDRNQKIILIVEDDKDFRLTLRGFLEQLHPGASVHEAENGFTAGKMVEELKPDVVLLDIFLPGTNGFDVCECIRRDPDLQNTRILAMSGKNLSEIKNKILLAGADAFLPKPFGLEAFDSALEKLAGNTAKEEKQKKSPALV